MRYRRVIDIVIPAFFVLLPSVTSFSAGYYTGLNAGEATTITKKYPYTIEVQESCFFEEGGKEYELKRLSLADLKEILK